MKTRLHCTTTGNHEKVENYYARMRATAHETVEEKEICLSNRRSGAGSLGSVVQKTISLNLD